MLALRDGRAGVALAYTPFDKRAMDSKPLITGPWMVALTANDPLAARSSLRLADLAGAPSALWRAGRRRTPGSVLH
jgi:DNA-binding transcriptional LysR family regulator